MPDQAAEIIAPGTRLDRFAEAGEVEAAKFAGRQRAHQLAGPPDRFKPQLFHGRQVHGLLQQQVIEFVLAMGCVA